MRRRPFEIGDELHPYRHPDHKRPVTRRDFLAQGFLTGAAFVTAPSLFGLLGRRGIASAQAACVPPVGGGAGMIPFICFDLGGGAGISGSNVLVGGPEGQEDLLSIDGYSKQGLPAEFVPGAATPELINREMGLLFHSESAMLQGILEKTSQTTRDQTNGAVFCVRSDNDTENNPHNPLYGIAKVGANGGLLTLIGSESTESGGKSVAPPYLVDPALRPTRVRRASDATGLVDAGRLSEFLDIYGADRVVSAVERISGHRVDKLDEMGEQAIATSILRSAYSESTDLVRTYSDPTSLNPNFDPLIAGQPDSIFTADELGRSTFQKTSSIMKLVVEEHVGAGCIELGGYDYHDSTRTTGDRMDLAAGRAIGACLEYAARSCQDLAIYVFSDGSVFSDGQTDNGANGKGIWKGDNSSTSAAFMLVYSKDAGGSRPLMVPDLTQLAGERHQIGHYQRNGSVVTDATEISNSPARLSETIVLNYLALHGMEGQFASLLPEAALANSSALGDLLAFQQIRSMTP